MMSFMMIPVDGDMNLQPKLELFKLLFDFFFKLYMRAAHNRLTVLVTEVASPSGPRTEM